MNLNDLFWRRLHFQNVVMKCLSIESVEYCYFIPIILQLAYYWGDSKIACLCKIMSRQVKQHLTHATHIHFLLSPPEGSLEARKGSRKVRQQLNASALHDYRNDNADNARFSTKVRQDLMRENRQNQQLLFDYNSQNLLKSKPYGPLLDVSIEEFSYLPYLTDFYLWPPQKEPSTQGSIDLEELIKQQNLRASARYEPSFGACSPKEQRLEEKIGALAYKQSLRAYGPLKISSKVCLPLANLQLCEPQQNRPIFSDGAHRLFPVLAEPLTIGSFQKGSPYVNIFTPASRIGVPDQKFSSQFCLDKGKAVKKKKKKARRVSEDLR